MNAFLFAKNHAGFIDGTINQLNDRSPELNAWQQSDAIINGWLTTPMEKEIHNSVKYAHVLRMS